MTLLITLSGGADSVALLHLMLQKGYRCIAAHCNFHLRGEESDRDEQFVRDLCSRLNVPLHTVHFDTIGYAQKKKISIEMAARELRYQWFEEIRKKIGADFIATAHHADDNVETLLLNLIRGTGLKGLTGIAPKNNRIVRPLLHMQKQEILDYLHSIGESYVTDSTNLQDEYRRNKIRLHLLPLMEEINPSVRRSIHETAERLRGAYAYYSRAIEEARERVMQGGSIRIDLLRKEPSPSALLYEILYPLGFNPSQLKEIEEAMDGQPGKRFLSPEWEVVKDREMLLIERRKERSAPQLSYETREVSEGMVIERSKTSAFLDGECLRHPLHLRPWREGDWFIPFGMRGKKRVSKYMTDRKFSLLEKERQWVLCCGEDIVWVVGERIDQRYALTPKSRKVVIVRLVKEGE